MSEFIEEVEIKSYDHLVSIICGKSKGSCNLRNKFIFRGVEDERFELIPSALRKNSNLNDFVDEDFQKTLQSSYDYAVKKGLVFDENKSIPGAFVFLSLNKEGNKIDGNFQYVSTVEEFQYLKEVHVLMNFFDRGDKVGLKIPASQDIRRLLDHGDEREDKYGFYWPNPNYFELISLAQHYGIPTRALDWSYDYKVSLYFAVKNILSSDYLCSKKPKNAVLWAFNYKLLEMDYLHLRNQPFAIKYYRPEYNSNPNLNAQKGLFTFIINDLTHIVQKSFEEFIVGLLSGTHDIEGFEGEKFLELPKDEKAFYKFIIPENIKPQILKDLYLDGYSEEYLFPGYSGVTQSIENHVKLDKIIFNNINCNKKNVLLVLGEEEIEKIVHREKLYIFKRHNFLEEIDKIFIYSAKSNEIIGCFRGNEIFANTPLYFWKTFNEACGCSENELYEYFERNGWGWAVTINDLIVFDNKIKLYNFKEPTNYCYVENRDELKFLLNFKL